MELVNITGLTPSTQEWIDDLRFDNKEFDLNNGGSLRSYLAFEQACTLWFLLRALPDTGKNFPHGKWALIQYLEGQIMEVAEKLK